MDEDVIVALVALAVVAYVALSCYWNRERKEGPK